MANSPLTGLAAVTHQDAGIFALFQALVNITTQPIIVIAAPNPTDTRQPDFVFLTGNQAAHTLLEIPTTTPLAGPIRQLLPAPLAHWLGHHLMSGWQQNQAWHTTGGPLDLSLEFVPVKQGLDTFILITGHPATLPTALHESTERLGQLLDMLPGIVFSFRNTTHWPMQYLSEGCRDLTGYTNTELLYRSGEAFNEITHPQDIERVLQTIDQALTQQCPYDLEYRIITKAGEERWVREYGMPVLGQAGPGSPTQVVAVDGFIRDITDWKYITQAISGPMPQVSTQVGHAFFMNLALHLTETLRVDYALIAEIISPTQAETRAIAYHNQITDNIAYNLAGTPCAQVTAGSGPCFFPNGIQAQFPADLLLQQMGIEAYVGIPLFNSQGQCLGLIAVMHQAPLQQLSLIAAVLQIHAPRVTVELERQRGERALQAAEAKWRSLVQYSSDLISIVSASGEIHYHSPAMERLLGYLPETSLGRSFWEFVHPADQSLLQQAWESLTHTPRSCLTLEFRARHRDGSWRYLESTAQNFLDDPHINGIVINTRDVSDHRETTGKLQQLVRFEQVLTTLATQFINIPVEEIDQGIHDVLRVTGEFAGGDRAYLFLVDDASGTTISNTHEWCNIGISAERDTLQHLVIADLPDFFAPLLQLDPICLPHISELPANSPTREILERQNIKSLVAAPIYQNRQFLGFVGIDFVQAPQEEVEIYLSLLEVLAEVIMNVLERQKQEAELRQAIQESAKSEAKYRSIFENTLEGIFQSSPAGFYISANSALAKIYGYESPAELQTHLTDIAHQLYVLPERRQEFVERLEQQGYLTDFESQVYRRDGQIIWIAENARVVKDAQGTPLYYEGTVIDITEKKLAESTIQYQAFHDLLTGLPNRALFDDRLPLALADARRHGESVAVMFLDLDRFKTINDTLGHAIGDQLLQQVSSRLSQCLREVDTIARWGGDEFTILLPGLHTPEDAVIVAERIIKALQPSFALENHQLHISTSLGIAIFPQDGEDADTLLRNADAALYRAKETGRDNYQLYQANFNAQASFLLQLEQDLRQALQQDEFRIVYQPQVCLKTGKTLHLEGLVRWQHPRLGLLTPGDFIVLAEENSLIIGIGQWMLYQACHDCYAWQTRGLQGVGVSVNLSARQFLDPQLFQTIHTALSQSHLPPHLLTVEITETTAIENVKMTQDILRELRRLGVGIALDDFGTGYASLNYLKKFPLTQLKIDRSFILDIVTDQQDQAIVSAILSLGAGLGLDIVAEGVEDREQIQMLQSLGCRTIQGYICTRPLHYDDLLAWVTTGECLTKLQGYRGA